MRLIVETSLHDFKFWSGAKDTVAGLSWTDLDRIEAFLEDMGEEWTDTKVNDFFWFERDFIAEILGYESFDEIIEAHSEA